MIPACFVPIDDLRVGRIYSWYSYGGYKYSIVKVLEVDRFNKVFLHDLVIDDYILNELTSYGLEGGWGVRYLL